ncbi:MAG: pentapeptide repeat-containing protein [Alphaproteobacteria bacterium]|nr:pentapeptide repeat-containing protein [Alphaproteobacteria bacterium]
MSDAEIKLDQKHAIALWLQGRDVWNKWVAENPKADIDFMRVDFAQYRGDGKCPQGMKDHEWPFEEFHFPDGYVNFSNAEFDGGRVSFDSANFGKGDVSFSDASFGKGDVDFRGAIFGKGRVFCGKACLGCGKYDFSFVEFGGRAFFNALQNADQTNQFSFKNASFDGGLVFSSEKPFGCVPDLRETKYNHQIVLDKLECKPRRTFKSDKFFGLY